MMEFDSADELQIFVRARTIPLFKSCPEHISFVVEAHRPGLRVLPRD
jgi:hypothetical protein